MMDGYEYNEATFNKSLEKLNIHIEKLRGSVTKFYEIIETIPEVWNSKASRTFIGKAEKERPYLEKASKLVETMRDDLLHMVELYNQLDDGLDENFR